MCRMKPQHTCGASRLASTAFNPHSVRRTHRLPSSRCIESAPTPTQINPRFPGGASNTAIRLLSFRGVHLVSGLYGPARFEGILKTPLNQQSSTDLHDIYRHIYNLRKAARKNSASRFRLPTHLRTNDLRLLIPRSVQWTRIESQIHAVSASVSSVSRRLRNVLD